MKWLFPILLLINSTVYAQDEFATKDPGFETNQDDEYLDNDYWHSLNSKTWFMGKRTAFIANKTDAHSGRFAAKLVTKYIIGTGVNGLATTGKLFTTPPYINGGVPYTYRPDSITGWFKYFPQGNDSGFVEFILFNAHSDTIGYSRFWTKNRVTKNYTRFSHSIVYFSNATPHHARWLLSSSRDAKPIENSTIYVDDLKLIFNQRKK